MSEDKISVRKKRVFLSWFVKKHEMKRRESLWILNYLINHEIVLNKVRFIENAEATPRGIVISAAGTTEEGFIFKKENVHFNDPEQAFHDIRLNWHHDIYLELNFPNAWKTAKYLEVLEDNPYNSWNKNIPLEIIEEAEEAMDEFLFEDYHQQIMSSIEDSLDRKDRKAFYDSTQKLQELKELF